MPVPIPDVPPEIVPVWQQVAAWISLVIVGVIVGVYKFFSTLAKSSPPPEAARHVVLEQATLGDMKPLHDINTGVTAMNAGIVMLVAELKNLTTIIGAAIERNATEDEIERRTEIRTAQRMAEKSRPRRRRAAKPKA